MNDKNAVSLSQEEQMQEAEKEEEKEATSSVEEKENSIMVEDIEELVALPMEVYPKEILQFHVFNHFHFPHEIIIEENLKAIVVTNNQIKTNEKILAIVAGQPKQIISYMVEHVIGSSSFGVIFKAKCLETSEAVTIKKLLQETRGKDFDL